MKQERNAASEEAYDAVLVRYDSCKIALVKNFLRPFPDAFEAVMREFLAYDPENFLRFIVPDLVCDSEKFWLNFSQKQGRNVVKMACCIIQIRLALFKESDINKVESGSDSDDRETALRKLYGVFCDLTSENEQQISYAHTVMRVRSTVRNDELILEVTPLQQGMTPAIVIAEIGILWNRDGMLEKSGSEMRGHFAGRTFQVHIDGERIMFPYTFTTGPSIPLELSRTTVISTCPCSAVSSS